MFSVLSSHDPVVVESFAATNNTAANPAAGQRIAAFDDPLRFHFPIAEAPGDLFSHFVGQVAEEHIAAFVIMHIPVRMIVSM